MRSWMMGWWWAAAVVVAVAVGCATFRDSAGKSLASVALGVDAAMQGWGTWVAQGQASAAEEAAVRAAYGKYQAAMAIACNAYTNAVAGGDRTGWETARGVLELNRGALLELIAGFETKGTR